MDIDLGSINARVTLRHRGSAVAQVDFKSPRRCRFSPIRTDEDILEFVGYLKPGGLHSPSSSTAKKRTQLGAGIRKPGPPRHGGRPGNPKIVKKLCPDIGFQRNRTL
jgi:hypothetical protein